MYGLRVEFKVDLATKLHGSQSFLEANISLASQKMPRLMWSLKVHYRVHNSSPVVRVLSKMNPSHLISLRFF
jgi:hypothetical protein